VHSNDLLPWHGEEAERVLFPKIALGGERKAPEVAMGADIPGVYARRGETLLVERDGPAEAADETPQSLELEPLQLPPGQALDFAIPHARASSPRLAAFNELRFAFLNRRSV
jgi:hypothetical protein